MIMRKNEQVVEFTGDATALQHAKVALHVCALGVMSAVFQIAAARHVLTLQPMPKLDSAFPFNLMFSKFCLWAICFIS